MVISRRTNIIITQHINLVGAQFYFFFFRFIRLGRITKAMKHQKYSTYQMKQATLDS